MAIQITPNNISVLEALAEYYVLTCRQVQQICFPTHQSARATRKRLASLVEERYVQKHPQNIAFPGGNSGPVYYLAAKGRDTLASWYGDERFLCANIRRPRADRLFHWLAISDIHIIVAKAIEQQSLVCLEGWFNEWETVNTEDAKSNQYYLHTVFREQPPLSCSPDAAFLLCIGEYRKVFYVEADRGTMSINQVAASKPPGYAELARTNGQLRHFPAANVPEFTVLLFTSSIGRRNLLAKQIAKQERSDLWLFLAKEELSAESFLHQPITIDADGACAPLVKQTSETATASPDQEVKSPSKQLVPPS